MKSLARGPLSAALLSISLLAGGGWLQYATAAGSEHAQRGGMHERGGMMWMGRGMDRMLDAVQASDEQRTQIRQIAEAARTDLKAQREAGRGLHEQTRQLFVQPTVDANAAEALRQQMLAQHDRASQRMMQAMLEVSRVLSPEQRQKIGELMAQRAAHRHEKGQGRR